MNSHDRNGLEHIERDMLNSTVSQLRQLCRSKGFTGYYKLRKSQLISFICQKDKELSERRTQQEERIGQQKKKEIYKVQPTSPPPDCPICLEPINENENPITMPCSHKLHFGCFVNLCRSSGACPMCREQFAEDPQQKRDPQSPIPDEIQTDIAMESLEHFLNTHVDMRWQVSDDSFILTTGVINSIRRGMDQVSAWFLD